MSQNANMSQIENEESPKEKMARLMNIVLENCDMETTPMEQIVYYLTKQELKGFLFYHWNEIDRVEEIKGSNMYMVVRNRPIMD